MKKVMIAVLFTGLAGVPLAAQPAQPQNGKETPAVEARGHEAFAKARKEHRAKLKATHEKMEKLVKEYNKLKAGKKKDAKRAEIEKEVAGIHEEQLKFKAEQLVKFEQRLNEMKERFAQENSEQGKKDWVAQKTQKLIDQDGDLRALFEPPHANPMDGMRGHGPKGPRFGKPGKGPRFGGPSPEDDND